jgi:hypothetical protein
MDFKPAVARCWPDLPRGPTGLFIVVLSLVPACAGSRPVASTSPTPLEEDVPSVDRFLPPTYEEGRKVVMPVTFPDGTTAEILYPPDLDLAGTNIQPYTSAVDRPKWAETSPLSTDKCKRCSGAGARWSY